MIGDNYVTGDNIYLRELQSFFFEVLGMMSITHYGAIGDGRRDNYGPIQVAIDDANRRGLSFLYVPYGKFIYTGEFTNLIDPDTGKPRIIFMGNPHAQIVNIRTGEEIEIKQFGWFNADGDYYTIEEADAIFENKVEAEGKFVNVSGDTMTGSLAIGSTSTASGELSFAQGDSNTASGKNSHAEGYRTTASGSWSHAEGVQTTASGSHSHAEGSQTIASGPYGCHAEGSMTKATKQGAHAEGHQSEANGEGSHAEGQYCFAQGENQHVQGKFNIRQGTSESTVSTDYAHILGNGADGNNLSNAHTITWGGEAWFAGDVYVGSTSGTNKDAGSKKLATEEYVDQHSGGGNKSIITGTLENDYEATGDSNYPIPLVLSESSGTGISIINNGITIGSDISKVKATGIASVYAELAGNMKLALYKNSTMLVEAVKKIDAASKETLVIPSYLVSVSNGDVLYLRLTMANGDVVYSDNTWLTVEEV